MESNEQALEVHWDIFLFASDFSGGLAEVGDTNGIGYKNKSGKVVYWSKMAGDNNTLTKY